METVNKILPTAFQKSASGVEFYLAPHTANGFVTISLSLELNNPFDLQTAINSSLLAALLDRGTETRGKFEIASEVEELGADLSISISSRYLRIGARCLKDDLGRLFDLLEDLVLKSTFPQEEFDQIQGIYGAGLQRNLAATGRQASIALSQLVYPLGHPGYNRSTEDQLAYLTSCDRSSMLETLPSVISGSRLVAVASGDFIESEFEAVVVAFGEKLLAESDRKLSVLDALPVTAGQTKVHINGKPSVDIYLGHAVAIRRDDEDYYPLMLGIFSLGGNFGSRLMRQVRDEAGLTYGIGSSLSGVESWRDGMWRTSVTLSTENLEKGLDLTKKVSADFIREGVSKDELDGKKTTVIGSNEVGMSSAGSLTSVLSSAAERGKSIDWVRGFRHRVDAVTVDQVNDAVSRHLDVEKLSVGMAGEVE